MPTVEQSLNEARAFLSGEKVKKNGHKNGSSPNGRHLISITESDVVPENIDWIWPSWLAKGKVGLLEGDPGLGKSTITLDLAARLSRGALMPDGFRSDPTGTLLMSAEDGVADTIVPRLIAAGADMTRIEILEGVRNGKGDEEGIQIPRDLPMIEQLMIDRKLSLVIVDPLSVFLADGINENRNQEVRKALAPAMSMLENAGASGIFLRHWTK